MRFDFLIIIVVGLTVGRFTAADELPLRRIEAGEQLLVLTSGRVFSGRMTPRTNGYDVALRNGRLFVSNDQVRFKASSMEDAYLRMRASMQHLTPATHLELAQWCLANKQPTFARRELLDALNLDSEFQPARQMLESLVREERRSLEAAQQSASAEQARQIVADVTSGVPLPERRSLGGLPRHAALAFTRNVQPLLSNKCGNARCHGSQDNGFTILTVRGDSTSIVAEQNLAAALNQIDLQNPEGSPLLTATAGLHGGSRVLLFPGQTGRRQLTILRDWIAAVAAVLGPGEHVAPPTLSSPGISPVTNTDTPAFRQSVAGTVLPTVHGSERSTTETDAKHLQEAAIATRHDEFDPDLFNRRFHSHQN
ncbi:MAG: hypothetical protein R3C59_17315 [Planctomycetaceae bacterium]